MERKKPEPNPHAPHSYAHHERPHLFSGFNLSQVGTPVDINTQPHELELLRASLRSTRICNGGGQGALDFPADGGKERVHRQVRVAREGAAGQDPHPAPVRHHAPLLVHPWRRRDCIRELGGTLMASHFCCTLMLQQQILSWRGRTSVSPDQSFYHADMISSLNFMFDHNLRTHLLRNKRGIALHNHHVAQCS